MSKLPSKAAIVSIVVLFGVIGLFESCLAEGGSTKGGSKMGLTVIPSFSRLGIGVRSWINPTIGYELNGGISWNGDTKDGTTKFLYAFKTTKWRWYVVGALGYFSFNFDEDNFNGSASAAYVGVGIGGEKLLGIRKNHGLAFELGIAKGTVSMDSEIRYEVPGYGTYTQEISTETDYPPIYIGAAYTYYFK